LLSSIWGEAAPPEGTTLMCASTPAESVTRTMRFLVVAGRKVEDHCVISCTARVVYSRKPEATANHLSGRLFDPGCLAQAMEKQHMKQGAAGTMAVWKIIALPLEARPPASTERGVVKPAAVQRGTEPRLPLRIRGSAISSGACASEAGRGQVSGRRGMPRRRVKGEGNGLTLPLHILARASP
jgi:hypothetical protein